MRVNLAQAYGKSLNYTNIPNQLFKEKGIKKGLRNEDGTGVPVGLTRVSNVVGYKKDEEGNKINVPGDLIYRGISIKDFVQEGEDKTDSFEEACYLLLFGYLPNKNELRIFRECLASYYNLPDEFLEMSLLRSPGQNLMNKLQSAVLALYNYDMAPDDTDPYQTLLKGLNILAKLPSISCYAYQSKVHYFDRGSLVIHYPNPRYSVAENILYMMRADGSFTESEARLLDTMLVLHADHGGGNSSTFTNVVISSTDTDIYSAVSGSIGSLKGPRHGGANVRACEMMEAVISEIGINASEERMREVVLKILDRRFYDNKGLVYGFGHAVYTISDPRAEILRNYCRMVAHEKGRDEECAFYEKFEKVAQKTLIEVKNTPISNNVDYYSGYAYNMLGIPHDMFTPLFVCARMAGWLAHNIENKLYDGRIMRPATTYVGEAAEYVPIERR
ncbi:MAG: citrate synthase [Lachnospiraceae bacterium]|nr:citrate synthase [Lachnospiraceae bacterium]